MLDSQLAGEVNHFEGGFPYADVEKTASGAIYDKRPSNVKYADIQLEIKINMSKAVVQWLRDSFGNGEIRRNGSIIKLGYASGPGGGEFEVYRLNFYNAFISEAVFPDMGQNGQGMIKLVVVPESTRRDASKTNTQLDGLRAMTASQRNSAGGLDTGDFDTVFDGLSRIDPSKIRLISGLKLRREYTEDGNGNKVPGSVEVSNLAVTLKDSTALPFYDWFNDSVLSNRINERNVTITCKTSKPDGRKFTAATLGLERVGILKIEPLAQGTEDGDRGYVIAEMYAENCTIEFDPIVGF
jgi:hypothetical protein